MPVVPLPSGTICINRAQMLIKEKNETSNINGDQSRNRDNVNINTRGVNITKKDKK